MWQHANLKGVLATLLGLTLGAVSLTTHAARAESEPSVSIGDVKISVDAGIEGATAIELGRSLRATLDEELKQVAALGGRHRALIVSATITRVACERTVSASRASATISLAVLRADDRVLFAELRGRASIEEASVRPAALRSMALRRAAQRAVARLPEAMRRAN